MAFNVLFLCTHNSARSILSEAILNHLGVIDGVRRFQAFSAGSQPRPQQQPHPLGLAALQVAGISTQGLRSKSWDEFALPNAPHMDLVVTVCDNAAGEVCPFWPGAPVKAHWGYADPSAAGDEAAMVQAFAATLTAIKTRLERFVALPNEALQPAQLAATAKLLSTV
jgi:arsenate reductase (thioredoxin)